ncbi:MAG: enoyl-CoA hydratase/isomerase family protein [Alphaproteobacteria bacterium]|nr:enoyl-CoA hydratase/isomerase family protein [Alphaproteobacteria bacterium]
MSNDVLFSVADGIAEITLNRPAAMNALSLGMAEALMAQLSAWTKDDTVRAVVIRGAGDKAFCAGGDIRAMYDTKQTGGTLTVDFFRAEYRLNHLVFHYPKPYIALIDGVAMGGGVGLSVHAGTRIASARTLFAMPETGIGLFPDVGGSYFLPRCPGAIGMYLALTGARLRAADCRYSGIVDSYIEDDYHDDFISALRQGESVDDAVSRFSGDTGPAPLSEHKEAIDRCFSQGTVEEIQSMLEREGGPWAEKTLQIMAGKSPTSQKVARRQLRNGAAMGFDDCMVMEYRMSQHFMAGHDFFEGVRALIVDKDNAPQWQPDTLAGVDDAMVESYFAPLGADDLTFNRI